MKWLYCNSKDFKSIICTNLYKDTYNLCLSPNNKFNIVEYPNLPINDLRYLLINVNYKLTLDDIKKYLISLQQEYDNSSEVNSFYLNGTKCWFDKATRVGLVNAINLQKTLGKNTYTVWFNNTFLELDVDKALILLANIEDYAGKCYNVTQKHITEIDNLATVDEALVYDITAGYPEMLNIEIE